MYKLPDELTLFDNWQWAGKPATEQFGWKPAMLLTPGFFLKNGKADDEMIEKNVVPRYEKNPNQPIILDEESLDNVLHWDTPAWKLSDAIRTLEDHVTTIRKHLPNALVGFYRLGPKRVYWQSIRNHPDKKQWESYNRLFAKWFGPMVDFVCPSVYMFGGDSYTLEDWFTYAENNLRQAGEHYPDHPILTYMWPQYHTTPVNGIYPLIPSDIFRQQLNFVSSLTNHIVVFMLQPPPPRQPWLDTLIDFLKQEFES